MRLTIPKEMIPADVAYVRLQPLPGGQVLIVPVSVLVQTVAGEMKPISSLNAHETKETLVGVAVAAGEEVDPGKEVNPSDY